MRSNLLLGSPGGTAYHTCNKQRYTSWSHSSAGSASQDTSKACNNLIRVEGMIPALNVGAPLVYEHSCAVLSNTTTAWLQFRPGFTPPQDTHTLYSGS